MRIADQPATFTKNASGTITMALPPERPEPTRRQVRWLTEAEVQKKLKCSARDITDAMCLPEPLKFPAFGLRQGVRMWADVAIEDWQESARPHRMLLDRLVP